MPFAVDWTSPLALVVYIPGAVAGITAMYKVARWSFPPKPLLAFGHPNEAGWAAILFLGNSDAELERQMQANEDARISSLAVSYLIENKGDSAFRDMTTGVRTMQGVEHRFEDWYVQILAGRETAPVDQVSIPTELHEGMTETNRSENFTFWTRFHDDRGREWEARYEPRSRSLSYDVLRRGRFF